MDLTRRQFTQGLLASTAAAGLPACVATNPATGRSSFTGLYSIEDDIRIGREEAPKLTAAFGGAYDDRRLADYVSSVGRDLARGTEYADLPYAFTVLNSPVVNAVALPGGFVFITRGLLALSANEAETAGVLAHELGHVNARHSAERASQSMLAQGLLLGLGIATGNRQVVEAAQYAAAAFVQSYSRKQEFEADTLGVRYMSRAGYDPSAMVTFLKTLREHSILEARMMGLPEGSVDEYNIMSTHPRTTDRVEAAIVDAQTQTPAEPQVNRDGYYAMINGILFGDDPEQGVVRNRRFTHPVLRFEFEVPEGFILRNSPQKIVAQSPAGAAIVFDMGRRQRARDAVDYIRHEWAQGADLAGLERLDVNGVPAATATTQVRTQGGVMDFRLVALLGDGADVFRFMFVTPPRDTAALGADLRRTTYSFRRLSAAEAAEVRPLRLVTVRARADDTVEKLAATLPFGQYNEAAFRILNDLEGGGPLPVGGSIKVVAG